MPEAVTSIQSEVTPEVGDTQDSVSTDSNRLDVAVTDQHLSDETNPTNSEKTEQEGHNIESADGNGEDYVEVKMGEDGDRISGVCGIEGEADLDQPSEGFDEGDNGSEVDDNTDNNLPPGHGEDDTVVRESENLEDPDSAGKVAGTRQRGKRKKHYFDAKKVNKNLTLRDLKLEGFSGCYKMNSPSWHQKLRNLNSICELVKIPLDFVVHDDNAESGNAGLYKSHVSLHMNGVRVCDGYGDHGAYAKRDAVLTALKYLKHKGLRFWDPTNLSRENIKFVNWKQMNKLGHNKDMFKENLMKFLKDYLDNPQLVELCISGVGNPGKSKWKLKSLHYCVGQSLKLKIKNDKANGKFHMIKVNSILHTLGACPAPEKPVDSAEEEFTDDQDGDAPGPAKLRTFKKTDKFNPNMTNGDFMGIESLKLDKYHGVLLRSSDHDNIVIEMTKHVDVPCQFKFEGPYGGKPYTRWSSNLHINNLFVAKGFGKTKEEAQRSNAKTALLFLMSEGLHVIFEDKICSEQIKEVKRDDLLSVNLEEHFSQFLAEKTFLKMKFCCTANEDEKELFQASCQAHSLVPRNGENGELSALKTNNTLIKEMEVLPTEKRDPPAVDPPAPAGSMAITEEDFLKNPSIRHHVEVFVENNKMYKLQFPNNLDKTQRELVEVLAEKYELTYSLDEAGNVNIAKSFKESLKRCASKLKDREASESLPQPKLRLTKGEKREIRRKQMFPERYGPDGKRKGPPQSDGGMGKKRAVQFEKTSITQSDRGRGKKRAVQFDKTSITQSDRGRGKKRAIQFNKTSDTQSDGGGGKKTAVQFDGTSITPIRLSTGKTITRTINNDNLLNHFVPGPNHCVNRSTFSNPPPRPQTANQSPSQLLLQSRNTYDRIRSPDYQNPSGNWNSRAPDHSQNQYDHRSQQPHYDERASSGTYGGFNPYDSPFTSASQNSQFNRSDSQYQSGVAREHYQSNQGGGRNRRY